MTEVQISAGRDCTDRKRMLGMLIIFLRLLLSAESITSRFTGELKVLRPENLAVEIYEEGSPFAFLCQVPVLAGTLTLRVG